MATTKIVDVINRASIILQDGSHVRYPEAELLKFFNDAQREVVLHRPDAKMVTADYDCVAGSKQTLPATGLRLIDVVRNKDGRAITQVDRKILDETLPNWHETAASSNKIEHYVYDPAAPKVFYLYPKATADFDIEIVYSEAPADITISNFATDTQVISVDDVYAGPLLDFVLMRAYQKDSEYAGNSQRAQMHYQSFQTSLGMKIQIDTALNPIPSTPDVNAGRT